MDKTYANTIWKYEIPLTDEPVIEMPLGAVVRHVGEQDGQLCAWVQVIPTQPMVRHRLRVAGIGHPLHLPDEGSRYATSYVGTVVMADGFVWHVWDLGHDQPLSKRPDVCDGGQV